MVGGVVIETVPDTLIPLAIEIVLRWLPPPEALTRELPEPTPTNSEGRKPSTSILSVPDQIRSLALAAIGAATLRSSPSARADPIRMFASTRTTPIHGKSSGKAPRGQRPDGSQIRVVGYDEGHTGRILW
jgi:hypothetical protein